MRKIVSIELVKSGYDDSPIDWGYDSYGRQEPQKYTIYKIRYSDDKVEHYRTEGEQTTEVFPRVKEVWDYD